MRTVKQVRDMEIDEISLVDRPANQHALVTIAKRAPEEEAMPDYFLEDGSAVDLDTLEPGDVVYDEEGNGFEYYEEDAEEQTDKAEEAANAAGVSKAFESKPSGFAAEVRELLSKAATDSDRDDIISKALERIETSEMVTQEAVTIAKAERTLRLEREYISKAAEYNVPIEPEQLGPVLMRMAEGVPLSYDDCAVIHKALTAAGELIYEEAGYVGQGDNDDDPMSRVEAFVEQGISKAAGQDAVSKAQGMSDYFTEHPEEYEAYKYAMSR